MKRTIHFTALWVMTALFSLNAGTAVASDCYPKSESIYDSCILGVKKKYYKKGAVKAQVIVEESEKCRDRQNDYLLKCFNVKNVDLGKIKDAKAEKAAKKEINDAYGDFKKNLAALANEHDRCAANCSKKHYHETDASIKESIEKTTDCIKKECDMNGDEEKALDGFANAQLKIKKKYGGK